MLPRHTFRSARRTHALWPHLDPRLKLSATYHDAWISFPERLGIEPDFYQHYDVHIHVPAGAIPKDGPSAGITMATALISALTQRPVYKRVAMTGEITLRGRVLPIGGVKEKVLAAQRAGVHTVILPKENRVDLRDVPDSARSQLRFVFAEHMDEVLQVALQPVSEGDREPATVTG